MTKKSIALAAALALAGCAAPREGGRDACAAALERVAEAERSERSGAGSATDVLIALAEAERLGCVAG